jgi:hypothetical protein
MFHVPQGSPATRQVRWLYAPIVSWPYAAIGTSLIRYTQLLLAGMSEEGLEERPQVAVPYARSNQ